MLESAELDGCYAFRTWTAPRATVVVGRAVKIEEEVRVEFCRTRDIEIVRRQSGGRSVLIGPGTLQYTFALPYSLASDLSSIGGAKRFCNDLLLDGLGCGRDLEHDESGDLVLEGRKVAGLALRRRRHAMLLHGTILVDADLELIASTLRQPLREPVYRDGRDHLEFLTNLGPVDTTQLEATVRDRLAAPTLVATA
jgi:lipoate-protein ligase A